MRRAAGIATGLLLVALTISQSAAVESAARLAEPWPAADDASGVAVEGVSFASHSPFSLADVGQGEARNPATQAKGMLFLPQEASDARPAPAVVLLHGSGGVLAPRELTYGRQLAGMGVAALVVDVFGARRERGTGFVDRLLNITETMAMADAYSALRYLRRRGDVDMARVVLAGFSYGGMATTFAVQAQVADALAPNGPRFAAHVAFYAPCIARFRDTRTTGAPVLMLSGGKDAIVDRGRCAEVAADLRAGGSTVQHVVYPEAFHQWDGGFGAPTMIGRDLSPCTLEVMPDGRIRDRRTRLTMSSPLTRKLILGLCIRSQGYMIGRDDAVRVQSNRDFGRFLAAVFRRGAS